MMAENASWGTLIVNDKDVVSLLTKTSCIAFNAFVGLGPSLPIWNIQTETRDATMIMLQDAVLLRATMLKLIYRLGESLFQLI